MSQLDHPDANPTSVPPPFIPVLADKKSRFINYVVDYLMMGVVIFVLVAVAGIIGGEAAIQKIESIPNVLLSIAVILLYYVTLETMLGRTVGKMVTKTRVVDNWGNHPEFSQILVRTLSRMIPFEQFSVLFGKGRGWHDSLSRTCVVQESK